MPDSFVTKWSAGFFCFVNSGKKRFGESAVASRQGPVSGVQTDLQCIDLHEIDCGVRWPKFLFQKSKEFRVWHRVVVGTVSAGDIIANGGDETGIDEGLDGAITFRLVSVCLFPTSLDTCVCMVIESGTITFFPSLPDDAVGWEGTGVHSDVEVVG